MSSIFLTSTSSMRKINYIIPLALIMAVLLNQKLIRLEGQHSVPFSLEQMAYTYGGQTSTQVLTAIGIK